MKHFEQGSYKFMRTLYLLTCSFIIAILFLSHYFALSVVSLYESPLRVSSPGFFQCLMPTFVISVRYISPEQMKNFREI